MGVKLADRNSAEPTMEEILASIRRIIADDDQAKAPAAAAAVAPSLKPVSALTNKDLEREIENARRAEAAAMDALLNAQQKHSELLHRISVLEKAVGTITAERDEWSEKYKQRDEEARLLRATKDKWQRQYATLKMRTDGSQTANGQAERFDQLWNAMFSGSREIGTIEKGVRLEAFVALWSKIRSGAVDWNKHGLAKAVHPDHKQDPVEKAIHQELCKDILQIF